MDSYTAANIRIEDTPEHDFTLVYDLADTYNKPVEFIKHGIEACRLAEVSESYFIDRYLKGDKSIPLNPDVSAISRELQIEAYRR